MTRMRILCGIILAGVGLYVATAKAAEISSSTLTAVFDDEGKGRLAHLVDRNGRDFASERNVDVPLWSVEACKADMFTTKVVTQSNLAKGYSMRTLANGIELVWEDVGEVVEKAVATFVAKPGDASIRCRIAVTPKPGWALVETQFPVCALNECLGSSPKDDAIVIGSGHGGIMRYPMNPHREYWKNRQLGHSPGNLVAQFGCFYDDRCGLYTMAEDADGNEKELFLDRWYRDLRPDGTDSGGKLMLRWSRFEYSDSADNQPYDILLRGFSGSDGGDTTWHDAADIYKTWAQKQFWCKKTFLEKTGFLPQWTREAPVVMWLDRSWLASPDPLKKWLGGYWTKKFPDVPLLVIPEGWEQHGAWVAAEYFPVYPDEETFSKIVGNLRAANGHLWMWPSGHHWSIQFGKRDDGTYQLDFSKDFNQRAAPHAAVSRDGNVRFDRKGWLKGGTLATMCPGDPWTVEWWIEP